MLLKFHVFLTNRSPDICGTRKWNNNNNKKKKKKKKHDNNNRSFHKVLWKALIILEFATQMRELFTRPLYTNRNVAWDSSLAYTASPPPPFPFRRANVWVAQFGHGRIYSYWACCVFWSPNVPLKSGIALVSLLGTWTMAGLKLAMIEYQTILLPPSVWQVVVTCSAIVVCLLVFCVGFERKHQCLSANGPGVGDPVLLKFRLVTYWMIQE